MAVRTSIQQRPYFMLCSGRHSHCPVVIMIPKGKPVGRYGGTEMTVRFAAPMAVKHVSDNFVDGQICLFDECGLVKIMPALLGYCQEFNATSTTSTTDTIRYITWDRYFL